jgi:hypothetical protein
MKTLGVAHKMLPVVCLPLLACQFQVDGAFCPSLSGLP